MRPNSLRAPLDTFSRQCSTTAQLRILSNFTQACPWNVAPLCHFAKADCTYAFEFSNATRSADSPPSRATMRGNVAYSASTVARSKENSFLYLVWTSRSYLLDAYLALNAAMSACVLHFW